MRDLRWPGGDAHVQSDGDYPAHRGVSARRVGLACREPTLIRRKSARSQPILTAHASTEDFMGMWSRLARSIVTLVAVPVCVELLISYIKGDSYSLPRATV